MSWGTCCRVNGKDLFLKGCIVDAFVALFGEPVADEGESLLLQGGKDTVDLPGISCLIEEVELYLNVEEPYIGVSSAEGEKLVVGVNGGFLEAGVGKHHDQWVLGR